MSLCDVAPQPPQAAAVQPIPPEKIAIRMADEGVPLRAIARTTQIASDELRLILQEAKDAGTLVEMPVEDWPVGSNRSSRSQAVATIASTPDAQLDLYLAEVFGATKLEAGILIPLLRRPEARRESIHDFIESRRVGVDAATEIKMVDVVVCKLRKKLKKFGLPIVTKWGWGYKMEPEHRKKAIDMLMAYANNREI